MLSSTSWVGRNVVTYNSIFTKLLTCTSLQLEAAVSSKLLWDGFFIQLCLKIYGKPWTFFQFVSTVHAKVAIFLECLVKKALRSSSAGWSVNYYYTQTFHFFSLQVISSHVHAKGAQQTLLSMNKLRLAILFFQNLKIGQWVLHTLLTPRTNVHGAQPAI